MSSQDKKVTAKKLQLIKMRDDINDQTCILLDRIYLDPSLDQSDAAVRGKLEALEEMYGDLTRKIKELMEA